MASPFLIQLGWFVEMPFKNIDKKTEPHPRRTPFPFGLWENKRGLFGPLALPQAWCTHERQAVRNSIYPEEKWFFSSRPQKYFSRFSSVFEQTISHFSGCNCVHSAPLRKSFSSFLRLHLPQNAIQFDKKLLELITLWGKAFCIKFIKAFNSGKSRLCFITYLVAEIVEKISSLGWCEQGIFCVHGDYNRHLSQPELQSQPGCCAKKLERSVVIKHMRERKRFLLCVECCG